MLAMVYVLELVPHSHTLSQMLANTSEFGARDLCRQENGHHIIIIIIIIIIINIIIIIIIIINLLTVRVVGAPQMISQPLFSIFPCSPLPSGTCRTPGLSIP